MMIISRIGAMAAMIAVYYGVTNAIGPKAMASFWDFMFKGYIELWDMHFAHRIPAWNHPVILVIAAALVLTSLPGLMRISRQAAAFVVALFLVRLGFAVTGASGAPAVSPELALYALFAAGWLLFSSSLGDRSLWTWIRHRNA